MEPELIDPAAPPGGRSWPRCEPAGAHSTFGPPAAPGSICYRTTPPGTGRDVGFPPICACGRCAGSVTGRPDGIASRRTPGHRYRAIPSPDGASRHGMTP